MSGKAQKRLRKFAKKMGDDSPEVMNIAKKEYNLLNKNERATLNSQMRFHNRIGE